MIAMCAAWVTMLMKLTGVRKRSDSEPKTAISTQEQQQRRVLQRQHAQRGWRRPVMRAAPLTPSHMARAQDRLAIELRPRRTLPRISPWPMTRMRSHMPISSSISEEIIRMPAPSAARRLMIL